MILNKIYVGFSKGTNGYNQTYHLYKPIALVSGAIAIQYVRFEPEDADKSWVGGTTNYFNDYTGYITSSIGQSKYRELFSALGDADLGKLNLASNYKNVPQNLSHWSNNNQEMKTLDFLSFKGTLTFYNQGCFKTVIDLIKANRLYS